MDENEKNLMMRNDKKRTVQEDKRLQLALHLTFLMIIGWGREVTNQNKIPQARSASEVSRTVRQDLCQII